MKLFFVGAKLKVVAISVLFACQTAPALAENKTLVPGYPGCVTEELLSQFMSASVSNDEQAMTYLEGQGCSRSLKTLPYSMIDFGFAVSEIRVYLPSGSALELFVPTEATR